MKAVNESLSRGGDARRGRNGNGREVVVDIMMGGEPLKPVSTMLLLYCMWLQLDPMQQIPVSIAIMISDPLLTRPCWWRPLLEANKTAHLLLPVGEISLPGRLLRSTPLTNETKSACSIPNERTSLLSCSILSTVQVS